MWYLHHYKKKFVPETRQRLLTAALPPAKATEQDLSIRVSYILRIYTYILRQCTQGSGQEVAVRAVYSRWRGSVQKR